MRLCLLKNNKKEKKERDEGRENEKERGTGKASMWLYSSDGVKVYFDTFQN